MKETFEEYGIILNASQMRSGGDVKVKCPQCSEERKKKNDPCLGVNVEQGVWKCHHCGWAGSLKNKEEKEVAKPVELPKKMELSKKAYEWFRSRGIGAQTLEKNGVFEKEIYMNAAGKKRNAICFPYYENGQCVNVKYRDGEKNFQQEKGAKKTFFGVDRFRDVKQMVITEGEIDKMSMDEAGIENVVSIPDGAPSVPKKGKANLNKKFGFLENNSELVDGMERVYLAVDADKPGQYLREELARRIGRHRCLYVDWPEGCKDANEVLVEYGSDKLKECLEKAWFPPIEGVFGIPDVQDDVFDMFRNGIETGYSTEWKCLDPLYTPLPGMITVITGVPGHGKSNFTEELAVRLAGAHGWKFGFFSPEHFPIKFQVRRLAQIYAGRRFFESDKKHRQKLQEAGLSEGKRMNEVELKDALRFVDEQFKFIRPEGDDFRLEVLLEVVEGLVLRHGINALTIDPWNSLDHIPEKGEDENTYVYRTLNRIRKFASKYDVHIFIVAHPRKMPKDEDGHYKTPNLYSISGSAQWFNKPDFGITVYRDRAANRNQIHIQKVKWEEFLGSTGVRTFYLDPDTTRFNEEGCSPERGPYSFVPQPKEEEIFHHTENAPF